MMRSVEPGQLWIDTGLYPTVIVVLSVVPETRDVCAHAHVYDTGSADVVPCFRCVRLDALRRYYRLLCC